MIDDSQLKDLLNALKKSIQLEQEGQAYFIEAARTVQGKHAQQTFEFLAKEEDTHIARIREFFESLQSEDTEPVVPEFDESDEDNGLEAFQQRLADLSGELQPTMTDAEAYEHALKFENGAEDFYREQMETTPNPYARRFYRWLIREERMHARILQSCIDFAADPAEWFRRREQK